MTAFILKLIALATMLIDHTGVVLGTGYAAYFSMRMIGRAAFPIYAFLIAEGCRHTRDRKKYLLRLGLFAMLSELPFDLCIYGTAFDFSHQNVFFTLALGAAALWAYQSVASTGFAAALSVVPFAAAAHLFRTDYGLYGVVAIFLCGVCQTRPAQVFALGVAMLAVYIGSPVMFVATLPSMALLLIYNGRRGYPALKLAGIAFYAAYPIHLTALAFLRFSGY